jgi:hypothetical protein
MPEAATDMTPLIDRGIFSPNASQTMHTASCSCGSMPCVQAPTCIDFRVLEAKLPAAGHAIHWQIGPERIRSSGRLVERLAAIARDPSKRQPDPRVPARMKLPQVVVEPLAGATYGDVAATVDVVCAAGFTDITFAGGQARRGK